MRTFHVVNHAARRAGRSRLRAVCARVSTSLSAFMVPSLGQLALADTQPNPPPSTVVASPVVPMGPTTADIHKDAEVPVVGKWSPKIYGFVELDAVEDTTQSFNDLAGNTAIARPGTYAGEHPRFQMAVPNSRLGFKFNSPKDDDLRFSGVLEIDFLGSYPSTATEGTTFTSPFLRVRHAWFKLETPFVDLTVGQTWQLFGWQPYFHPSTLEIQGVPGEVYSRAPQVRASHSFKGEALTLDMAVSAARAPQRDAGLPDLQAGLKMTVNGWKGLRTYGSTGAAIDALGIGVSGALRWFKVADFEAKPTRALSATGWAVSVDAFLPIIPAELDDRANALTFTSSFAAGAAYSDFYTALNGGLTFPPLPNPTALTPAPAYTPNVDNGLVVFDSVGHLKAVQWWSFIAGFQYHLPPSGMLWLAANYSHMHSSNIVSLGSPSAVFDVSNWFDVNLFYDVATAIRFGISYAWFEQTYGDDVKAHNSRFQASGFYLF